MSFAQTQIHSSNPVSKRLRKGALPATRMYPREFPATRCRKPKRLAERHIYEALGGSHRQGFVMLGSPGVGKTHLAVALAKKAIELGYGAHFVRACELTEGLRKTGAEHIIDRRLRVCPAPRGLAVDQFGIRPCVSGGDILGRVGERLLTFGG